MTDWVWFCRSALCLGLVACLAAVRDAGSDTSTPCLPVILVAEVFAEGFPETWEMLLAATWFGKFPKGTEKTTAT